jgi:ATP-binding cassette, subfamily B, multidrug efflux pump
MKHMRKLFYLLKPYWKESILSLVLLTTIVFLDLAIPRLIQRIIDQGIARNDTNLVLQTALIMLGVSLASAVFAIGNNFYSVRAGEGFTRDLREVIFLKVQDLSYGDLDHFTTGNLMVRLASDTGAVQRLVQVTLRIGTRAPLMMIGSLILMITTNSQLALTMLPLLLVTSVVLIFFSVKMEPLFRVVQQKLDRLNTVLQENVAGARLVKAFVRADYESQRFGSANDEFADENIRVMRFMSSMGPVLTSFVNVGIVIVIWAGGLQAIRGDLTIGQIVAFTNYMLTTMGPLTMMTMLANVWANGFASAQRINEVLDTVPQVLDVPDARPLPERIAGRVEFENVYFHYNGSKDEPVLEDINLVVEPGQTVAILGATGAGKSSLIHLIARFYDATAGRILVDGIDIREVQQDSLHGKIGIVPQETILFSGSVRDNIRYGRPEASEEEVIAAARAAQAHEFILQLPQAYDTHIEERGVNLSGGQKQRIAIARALAANPSILILDDSTSSVDVETETRIQEAMEALMHGRTNFVVAQRISTVLNADKIIVIDKGRVAAEGTHSELIQTSPIYQEIFDSQLGNGVRVEG